MSEVMDFLALDKAMQERLPGYLEAAYRNAAGQLNSRTDSREQFWNSGTVYLCGMITNITQ